jgi:SAM-dependent methyltransferase
MKVHGIDLSETGIRGAQNLYGRFGITFGVSDVQKVTFPDQFDCIFVRSCSLYNGHTFPLQGQVTDSILRHLKVGGTFIFAYNSNFSSKVSPTWRYHSLEDVRQHFAEYPNAEIFFLNRITTYLLRKYSISAYVTRLNVFLSKVAGIGGDLICILTKPHPILAGSSRTAVADSGELRPPETTVEVVASTHT